MKEEFLLLKIQGEETLVNLGVAVSRKGETIVVAHACEKWRAPDGSVDLTQVEVVYFELYVLAVGQGSIELWRDKQWVPVEFVRGVVR